MLVGAPCAVAGAEIVHVEAAEDYGVRAVERPDEIDWSGHEHDARVGGHRMRYVDIGAGEHTVVLVHGFSASWRVWTDVMPALADHYRVIAIDLPGFGSSEPPDDATMATAAGAVVELVQQVRSDHESVTMVGHSMGTLVVTEIAAAAPELVERVVLLGGPCTSAVRVVQHPTYVFRAPNLLSVLLEVVLGVIPLPKALHRFIARNAWARAIMLRPYAHKPRRIAPAMVANLLHRFGAPHNHAVLREARRYNFDIAARAVACPIFVVHGDKDLLVPPSDVEKFAAMAPVKKVFVLRQTGHNAEIERPNTLNKVLLRLLVEEQSSSAPTAIAP
jgi:pimeloyl-ACP methyl ester carboxylesterase